MFGGDDEDGDFLSPAGGLFSSEFFTVGDEGLEASNMSAPGDSSDYQWKEFQGAKLASLFGLNQEGSQGNESFQYTAPKQPKKSFTSAAATQKQSRPSDILTDTVLGNHSTKEYKLLLYLSQQKQVAAAKIHLGFVFTVQPNNYCTFYDEQRQNWSLMFESEKASSDFCKEVCLAKANSVVPLEAVVVQDLSLGEGQAVENGDSLEVVYTGWLLQNHTIGEMFDTNQNKDKSLRLKIGAGKVIKGWEEGMVGLKKAGRRLVVVPPDQAYGAKGVPNRVPANSTLIFEVELRRVKFSKDNGSVSSNASTRGSAAPSPVSSPAPSGENVALEPPPQTTASGPGRPGEQLANPDATKAKLISRMAKMGQPMLPFLTGGASQPESSDSELEDTSGSRVREQPAAPSPLQISASAPAAAPALHPHTAPPSALLPFMSTAAPQPGLTGSSHAFQPYSYTQSSGAPSQLQPVGQVYPAQPVPYMGSSDVTSFLMTEARQHNTEIRLSVGKVADKVDQLASKIDDLQRHGSLSVAVPSLSMETSMIMHNIQRIVQENECLKKEVFDKSSRIEEQNRKIGELINQNQRYMEQSHLVMEQRNDSLKSSSEQNQARLLQAEQDKHALPQDLGQEAAERAQAQYRSEKQRRKEMVLRVNNMEEEVQDLKTDKDSLERTLSERRQKWQAERQRRDEEVEELRKSSQLEQDNLRALLRKARSSTDTAAAEQLCQQQAELEEQWRGRCEQMMAGGREQHSRDLAEVCEQRDALQDRLTQLQDKFTAVKQSRNVEEQTLLQHRGQTEELQALQGRYTTLEQQAVSVREALERRVAELEQQGSEQQASGDSSAEVKRVMNGVFHSLRGQFDLSESYSGQAVLGVIVTTIKNVTLQLLTGTDRSSLGQEKKEAEEEEEEEEESDDVKQRQETVQNIHVNGDREVQEKELEAKSDSQQVSESQTDEDVAAETETLPESETVSPATDLSPLSTTEPKLHETAECEVQQEISSEQKETFESADPHNIPEESPAAEHRQEPVSEGTHSSEGGKESEGEREAEMQDGSQKAFGPPANPPPPPNALPDSSGEEPR
ncbi:FK506-binding protein 15 [Dissostichus eleginoides]|uniref:peptidylprolyl isomerase n=1 Tax=Dissostichus eleginoides TaxID=100907 RepID=A0AAD9F4Q2_DISEL|nr:FK506-binding protein 15 [Dissostichus eleginoides]